MDILAAAAESKAVVSENSTQNHPSPHASPVSTGVGGDYDGEKELEQQQQEQHNCTQLKLWSLSHFRVTFSDGTVEDLLPYIGKGTNIHGTCSILKGVALRFPSRYKQEHRKELIELIRQTAVQKYGFGMISNGTGKSRGQEIVLVCCRYSRYTSKCQAKPQQQQHDHSDCCGISTDKLDKKRKRRNFTSKRPCQGEPTCPFFLRVNWNSCEQCWEMLGGQGNCLHEGHAPIYKEESGQSSESAGIVHLDQQEGTSSPTISGKSSGITCRRRQKVAKLLSTATDSPSPSEGSNSVAASVVDNSCSQKGDYKDVALDSTRTNQPVTPAQVADSTIAKVSSPPATYGGRGLESTIGTTNAATRSNPMMDASAIASLLYNYQTIQGNTSLFSGGRQQQQPEQQHQQQLATSLFLNNSLLLPNQIERARKAILLRQCFQEMNFLAEHSSEAAQLMEQKMPLLLQEMIQLATRSMKNNEGRE